MTLHERQLTVGILLSLTLVVRTLAQRQAGGVWRDQSDGLAREGNRQVAAIARLLGLGALAGTLAWLLGAPLPTPMSLGAGAHVAGLLLAQAGAVMLLWVELALGVNLSGTLHLREHHRLVVHGPYARIRHPMYTAFILLFLGLGLLIGDALVLVAMLATQVWTVGYRLPREEASLEERFGEAWREHRGRTGALTPWF